MLYAKLNGVLIESRVDDSDAELDIFKADLSNHDASELEFGVETEAVIDGWWDAQTEAAKTYSDKRKAEYKLLNQFEMQFDDDRDSTTTWVDKINEIKGRHPKP